MNDAVSELWIYVDDLFDADELERSLQADGLAVDTSTLREKWNKTVQGVFAEAGLEIPERANSIRGSRKGHHSEHLGHLLAEMQVLHRTFPGAEW
jgi:ring-1,2-phenylacetyl-CoA epoxidase subunit PaaC